MGEIDMIMTGIYSTNLLPILSLQLLLFIILFGYSFRHIRSQFKRPSRQSIAVMAFIVIILAGFCDFNTYKAITLTVAKEFSFGNYQFYYPTEAYGIEPVEHNLAGRGRVKYILGDTVYPWGPVYPFLLSFFLFGHNPIFMMALDIFMMALLIPILFFLMFLITRDEGASLLTTLFFSAIMIFIYSCCNQFLEIYLFFFTLTLLLMFVSYKLNRPETYALTFLSILFTMEILFESIVMLPVFFIGILLFRHSDFRNRKSFFNLMYKMRFVLILFLLLSPIYFIKVASVKTYLYQYASITTPSDSLYEDIFGMLYSFQNPLYGQYLPYFPSQFIWFWSQGILFPLALLAILGAFFNIKRYWRKISFLMIIFIMHTFIYLHIGNGYQTGYAMRTIIPVLVISGLGIGTIIKYLKRYPRFLQWMPASIVVFMVITLSFISTQARPLVLMEYMNEERQPFLAGLGILAKDTNIGTIIVNSKSIENKAEFLTLHDAFTIQPLVSEIFYFPEIQKFSGYYGGGLDFNKSLEESKIIRRAEMLKYMLGYIEGNSSYMGKLSNIILEEGRNNYYIKDSTPTGLFEEMEFDFIRRNFRMEMLSNTSGMVIYKLSR